MPKNNEKENQTSVFPMNRYSPCSSFLSHNSSIQSKVVYSLVLIVQWIRFHRNYIFIFKEYRCLYLHLV